MMTIKEIREKNPDQLRSELGERQKHLFDLRSQAVTEKLEDPSQLRKTRKEIARILTVLHQRHLEGQASGTTAGGGGEAGAAGASAEAPAARTRTPRRTRPTKRPAAAAKRAVGTKRTPRAAKEKKSGTKPARKPAARKAAKQTKAKKTKAKASA